MSARHASVVPLAILLPGLWMPSWVMAPLAWRLRARGIACVRFGYPSMRESLEQNVDRLAGLVRTLGEGPLHLVGHSLGGVLALHAASSRRLARIGSIVMLGSPACGSFVARQLAQRAWGRRALGRTVLDWQAVPHPVAPEGVAVGVIAGTGAFGLGMVVAPDLPRPHDGVVAAMETEVRGAADRVRIPLGHAALLTSPTVARLVGNFIVRGRFDTLRSSAHMNEQSEGPR